MPTQPPIKKQARTKKAARSITVPPDAVTVLQRIAEREDRTFSSVIRRALLAYDEGAE